MQRTFDDVWRIALSDCVMYARKQLAVRYGTTSTNSSTNTTTATSTSIPTNTGTSTSSCAITSMSASAPLSQAPLLDRTEVVATSTTDHHRHPQWECLHRHNSLCGGPSARIGHCMTVVGHQLVVYGGRNIHQVTTLHYTRLHYPLLFCSPILQLSTHTFSFCLAMLTHIYRHLSYFHSSSLSFSFHHPQNNTFSEGIYMFDTTRCTWRNVSEEEDQMNILSLLVPLPLLSSPLCPLTTYPSLVLSDLLSDLSNL